MICYYQNVRGLRTKVATFRRNLQLNDYDVLAIAETWLWDGISDTELFDDRYSVWRRDRRYDLTDQKRGGGVLLAVSKDYHVVPRPEWNSTAEDLWLSIKSPEHSRASDCVHICIIYLCAENKGLSFRQQLNNFTNCLRDIMTSNPLDRFIVLGDFNMRSIMWSSIDGVNHLKPSGSLGRMELEFLDELDVVDLRQYNYILNQGGVILDLFLSNLELTVSACSNPLVPLDAQHHGAMVISMCVCIKEYLKPAPRTKYCYNKANYDAFNEDLLAVNWNDYLSNNTLDEALDSFYNIIKAMRDKYVPQKIVSQNLFPPWYSPALKKVLKEKFKYYKKFKRYGMLADKITVDYLKVRAKVLEEGCFNLYISSVEKSIKDNPRYFWSYLKSLSKSTSIPNTMSDGVTTTGSGSSICNMFADYFHSTFLVPQNPTIDSYSNNSDQPLTTTTDCSLSSVELSIPIIKIKLLRLDRTKSSGPDSIPPLLLIKCADSLCIPLLTIFNRSIKEGYVPTIWKSAFITPVHKKGPKDKVNNYRPISKLCILAKLFERIIYEQVYGALKNVLPSTQHGFLPGRSTVSNLVLLNETLTEAMDNGYQTDVVYTDYSKAFDRIDHHRLIFKLSSIGIRGDLLRWFTSYIHNRSQVVVLGNYTSRCMNVPSGVPQGSLLGPLLFLVFIADIDSCFLNSSVLAFADDMKILRQITCEQDAKLLQDDLDRLDSYCLVNKLELNPTKCNIMTYTRKVNVINFSYTIKGHTLQRVNEVKDLGVIHDSKLLFDSHVSSIVKKASKALGFVMRSSKDFKNIKTIKILYCTYVRCHLEYASQVWNPAYEIYIDRLEAIQRKFLRFLNYKTRTYHSDYVLNCAKQHLVPLYLRREFVDILYLLKIINSAVDCPPLLSKIQFYAPTRTFRRSNLFYLPVVSTNYRQNAFVYRASKLFNLLSNEHDLDLFNCSTSSLKNRINNIFFDRFRTCVTE